VTDELERWAAEYLGVNDRKPGGRSGAERTRRWRARKAGLLSPFPFLTDELEGNAMRNPDTGCLEWIRSRNSGGYGHFKRDGKMVHAHRVSLERKLGRPLGPGMVARHTCDNPPCIEPEHLIEGTHAQNVADMIERGRAGWLKKEAPRVQSGASFEEEYEGYEGYEAF
jgi:hypothetical protein